MVCSVDGCDRPAKNKGLCLKHYMRMWRNGTTHARAIRKHRGTCIIKDCDKPDTGPNGLCHKHLTRQKRNGDPLALRGSRAVRGPDHAMWLGDDVGYGAVHCRLKVRKGSARDHPCVDCGNPAKQWAYDHKDTDEKVENGIPYSTNVDHYEAKCVSCHKRSDLSYLSSLS